MNKIISLTNKVANKAVRHSQWYNQEFWRGVTKFWNNQQFELEIVNLGSWPAVHAFCYDDIPLKARNWALGPQSLVHDYNILRNYFSFIKEEGVVILSICPFSCLISKYGKEHNFRYYTILHPATIDNFDDNERTRALKIKENPFGCMPAYCIKQTLKAVCRPVKMLLWSKKKVSLQSTADAMMAGWKKQFGIEDLSTPLSEKHKKEQQQRKQTLMEMIDFCKERYLRPIIVIPPMHKSLSTQFPKEFHANYIIPFLSGIDVPVYDYMYSDEFANDEYYKTALFLNKKGARRFTSLLVKRLRKEGVM